MYYLLENGISDYGITTLDEESDIYTTLLLRIEGKPGVLPSLKEIM